MIFCLFPYSQLVVLTLPVSCQSDSGSQAELRLKWPLASECVCVCVCVCILGCALYDVLVNRDTGVGHGQEGKGTNEQ